VLKKGLKQLKALLTLLTKSEREKLAFQKDIFNQQKELQEPFRQLGLQAAGQISQELSTPLTLTDSFKFRQGEEEKALGRILAARGGFDSGSGIRDSLGITSRITADAEDRRDRLRQIGLGTGTGAASSLTGSLQNLGILSGDSIGNIGSTKSAGELAQGQISADLFGNLSDQFGEIFGIGKVNKNTNKKIGDNKDLLGLVA
jgi:hypothetical protein